MRRLLVNSSSLLFLYFISDRSLFYHVFNLKITTKHDMDVKYIIKKKLKVKKEKAWLMS